MALTDIKIQVAKLSGKSFEVTGGKRLSNLNGSKYWRLQYHF